MVAPELKATKNVTFDKEGAGRPLEPRRFHVLSRLTVTVEVVRVVQH